MAKKIHPSAIVSGSAQIAADVEIGPFCIIGDNVVIGNKTKLKSHVVIEGDTIIGENNTIYPFVTIGVDPQDLKFSGENSKTVIGNNNSIREHVTIHRGTKDGAMITKVGNDCLLMVGAHVAHDCVVEDGVILANNATLAGHVEVGQGAIIGGLSAIHQFVRIGQKAMIGGMSGVEHDVIPYGLVMGERANLAGLNLIGLRRSNIERKDIHALRDFYKNVFESGEGDFVNRATFLAKTSQSQVIQDVANFVNSKSNRSFCQVKKNA